MEQSLSEEANNGFSAVYENQDPGTWLNIQIFYLIIRTFLSAVLFSSFIFVQLYLQDSSYRNLSSCELDIGRSVYHFLQYINIPTRYIM